MEFSKDLREKCKAEFKKDGKEYTDAEADEAISHLAGFFDLMFDCAKEDARKKARLKKEPGGFAVEGNYSCLICGNGINQENGWYDWYGHTCLICRKAIKEGVIPTFVCRDHDSYFPMWRLTRDLNVKTPTIKKFIKEGKLKARIILGETGRPQTYIFLKKENPNLHEQNNPARKSWQRNRDKTTRRWSREALKKWKAEIKESKKKLKIL